MLIVFSCFEVKAQSLTETFDTNPCGAPLCTTSNFSTTLAGIQFNYTFLDTGYGGDFAHESTYGDGGSASINLRSGTFNPGVTETIIITRNDGGDFIFNSIYLNNTAGQLVTVQGYNNSSTVGSA